MYSDLVDIGTRLNQFSLLVYLKPLVSIGFNGFISIEFNHIFQDTLSRHWNRLTIKHNHSKKHLLWTSILCSQDIWCDRLMSCLFYNLIHTWVIVYGYRVAFKVQAHEKVRILDLPLTPKKVIPKNVVFC